MTCYICDEPAIGRLSPDLDIRGIGYCKKHEEDMILAYMSLSGGDREMFDELIKAAKKRDKIKCLKKK